MFGIGHYINLLNNSAGITAVTSQVIYAFCIGILMCGLLYKTKNLWIPALIHSFLNLDALIRTFNTIRSEQIPSGRDMEVYHLSLWELVSQDLTFMLCCLVASFILIYHQHRKEKKELQLTI